MWHFSKGPSGWTDNDLAVLWVENVFDVNTKPSTPSEWRLLIIDGHASHTSSRFIDALWKQHILPVCLPAHAMHVMQPLDVSIFGPITAAYRHLVTELAPHVDAAGIDKAQFGTLYAQAQAKMLTSAAAKKAFQDTGLTNHPVPEKVLSRLAGSPIIPIEAGSFDADASASDSGCPRRHAHGYSQHHRRVRSAHAQMAGSQSVQGSTDGKGGSAGGSTGIAGSAGEEHGDF
ncbi:hypothetical protein sr17473 [Sporisorium reilianum SRZ2]|uniref:DDE-1 domain-containing protein n=1 Tax=Sporisorium reilianum (strain SRZ2) TaxID=999809 RepID=E6ZZ84_SPORE|nr:hypothetical protein sr17473 [Sporisorium reilianum SRZ2]